MLILVTGGSCSGKSTFAETLKEMILRKGHSCQVISTDYFYKDIQAECLLREHNFDSPDEIDQELLDTFCKTAGTEDFSFIAFEYSTHRRSHLLTIPISEIIILEGIFALAFERVRTLADFTIYIECDDDVRYFRRKQRYEEELGHSREMVDYKYFEQAEPWFRKEILPWRGNTDLLISGENHFKNNWNEILKRILISR